jgi:hypothetical protein
MATLQDMVDEVRNNLQGYTLRQDRITYVSTPTGLTTTTTQFQVGTQNNLAKGLIEIDDELLWIDSFDKSSGTMNVIPGFGRGYGNTTPSIHPQYSQVILSPTYTRVAIKNAINDTIGSVFPKLFAMTSYSFTYNPAQTTYMLPDDAQNIFGISWESVGPSKEWIPVKRYYINNMADSASFNSNVSITINEAITPGRTVQVWYSTEPNTLSSNSDDFADVTGLPASSKDVIVLGASYRLLSYIDPARISLTSAESDAANGKIPSSAGVSASKYLYALYQNRLAEEAGKLNGKFPIRIHYTR